MNRRAVLFFYLACSLAASMSACSIMPFQKSAKAPAPPKQEQASKVEWGERKWEEYGKDNSGITYYFDKSSITYPSKSIIHVWRRRVFPEAVPGAGYVRSSHKEIVGYDEMNCKTEAYRSLETQGVNWDDTTTRIFTRPTPWTPAFNDSADDRMLQNFCREAAKAAP
jgi:hypothetical protein